NKTKADSWTTEIVINHTNLNGVVTKSPTAFEEVSQQEPYHPFCRHNVLLAKSNSQIQVALSTPMGTV
ncbi:unnamed protein product, partial [Allacma fusca]